MDTVHQIMHVIQCYFSCMLLLPAVLRHVQKASPPTSPLSPPSLRPLVLSPLTPPSYPPSDLKLLTLPDGLETATISGVALPNALENGS